MFFKKRIRKIYILLCVNYQKYKIQLMLVVQNIRNRLRYITLKIIYILIKCFSIPILSKLKLLLRDTIIKKNRFIHICSGCFKCPGKTNLGIIERHCIQHEIFD